VENFFVHKNFFSDYRKLRQEFVENFKNAKDSHQKRFVWDFWYDEDQYHLIRTPAYYYFTRKVYQQFHSHLVQWGRENLGCHDISPPWLSYYVDGCYQKLHSDVPHGPWAFVYSLTPNTAAFKGGETLILKPQTLNYWNNYKQSQDYEYKSFVDTISSKMNQLIVFDPRFPHGVTEVKGTRDPLKSRLVMHGWFVNPRPYVTGGLSTTQVQKSVQAGFENLNSVLQQMDLIDGTVSVRLDVSPNGQVRKYKVLTNTLVSLSNKSEDVLYFNKQLKQLFTNTQFVRSRKESKITLPLIFK
jgi:hypothetical protein